MKYAMFDEPRAAGVLSIPVAATERQNCFSYLFVG